MCQIRRACAVIVMGMVSVSGHPFASRTESDFHSAEEAPWNPQCGGRLGLELKHAEKTIKKKGYKFQPELDGAVK